VQAVHKTLSRFRKNKVNLTHFKAIYS